jgi:hypothetical protein
VFCSKKEGASATSFIDVFNEEEQAVISWNGKDSIQIVLAEKDNGETPKRKARPLHCIPAPDAMSGQ